METSASQEQVIWQGSSSQWLNFRVFLLCGLGMVLAAPFYLFLDQRLKPGPLLLYAVALWLLLLAAVATKSYLDVRCRVYTVTSERMRITSGILSKETDDMELYRVEDLLVVEPFLLRLVSRGNITLATSDSTTPQLDIAAVPNVAALRDQIRKFVEICRDRKQTRVIDFEGHNQ